MTHHALLLTASTSRPARWARPWPVVQMRVIDTILLLAASLVADQRICPKGPLLRGLRRVGVAGHRGAIRPLRRPRRRRAAAFRRWSARRVGSGGRWIASTRCSTRSSRAGARRRIVGEEYMQAVIHETMRARPVVPLVVRALEGGMRRCIGPWYRLGLLREARWVAAGNIERDRPSGRPKSLIFPQIGDFPGLICRNLAARSDTTFESCLDIVLPNKLALTYGHRLPVARPASLAGRAMFCSRLGGRGRALGGPGCPRCCSWAAVRALRNICG